jgi:5-methylcytosine-specific restriction endonuclease McrA
MSEYSNKLKDPRWQKKRLEILQRDKWSCQQCGDEETELHVHHRYYEYNLDPWNYPDADMFSLCYLCHSKNHNLDKLIKKLMKNLGYDQKARVAGYIESMLNVVNDIRKNENYIEGYNDFKKSKNTGE